MVQPISKMPTAFAMQKRTISLQNPSKRHLFGTQPKQNQAPISNINTNTHTKFALIKHWHRRCKRAITAQRKFSLHQNEKRRAKPTSLLIGRTIFHEHSSFKPVGLFQ
ncbi:MAG: hypothetical protein ACWA6V_19675 [Cellvibrio sp.]